MTTLATSRPPPVDHDSLRAAADWYVRLQEDEDEGTASQWRAWLAQREAHRQAWQYVEAASQRMAPLRADGVRQAAQAGLQGALRRPVRQRRALLQWLLVGSGAALGWSAWQAPPVRRQVLAWRADHATALGEIRAVTLADGSQLWLDTASAVQVRLTATRREVELLQGAVLVQTAADPSRPFVVLTPQGELQALGTRFSVTLGQGDAWGAGAGGDHASGNSVSNAAGDRVGSTPLLTSAGPLTRLAVISGAVAVQPELGAPAVVVAAGQGADFTASAVGPVQAVSGRDPAWIHGVLQADDMPLHVFAAALSRYRPGRLQVAPEVAAWRVMGSYPLTDPEAALDLLVQAMSVRIERGWWQTRIVAR